MGATQMSTDGGWIENKRHIHTVEYRPAIEQGENAICRDAGGQQRLSF